MKLRSILPPLCVVLSAQIMHLWAQEYVAEYEAREWTAQWIAQQSGGSDPSGTAQDISLKTQAYKELMIAAGRTAAAENGIVRVHFTAGEYVFNNSLPIFSNTYIECDDNVVVKMAEGEGDAGLIVANHFVDGWNACSKQKDECNHYGYTQITNVVISGGVWDRNVRSDQARGCFRLVHGSDIVLTNMVIKNCTDHHVNLSGSANCTVSDVTFQNAIEYTGTDASFWGEFEEGDKNRFNRIEALHLDYCNSIGESTAFPWDDTPCKNITVRNCRFEKIFSGVGTHHIPVSGKEARDITIENCVFKDNLSYACYAFGFENFGINGCLSANAGGLLFASASDISATDNEVYGTTDNSIYLTNTVASVLKNVVKDSEKAGICTDFGSSLTAKGNSITNTGTHGISIAFGVPFNVQDNTLCATKNGILSEGGVSGGKITNNTITDSVERGIHVENATNLDVSKNTITTVKKSHGISTIGGSATITGNTVKSAKEHGICIKNGKATCSGNKVISPIGNGYYVSGATVTLTSETIDKPGSGKAGIRADAGANVTVKKCTISNTPSHGISLASGVKFNLDGNVIKAAKNGILSEGGVSGGKITNNKITDSVERGIHVENATNLDVSKNTITTVKKSHGISISGGSATITGNIVKSAKEHGICIKKGKATCSGNKIEAPAGNGYYISGASATLTSETIDKPGSGKAGIRADAGANVTVKKCTISNTPSHGISLASGVKFNLDGNVIKAAKNGILSEGGVSGGKITNNKITDSEERGIHVENATNLDVSKNTITTVKKSHGISISGGSATITGNIVKSAKEHGICIKKGKATCSGNKIEAPAGNGYYISGASATLTSETIDKPGSGKAGIRADAGANVTVKKCTISNTPSHGISLASGVKFNLDGNVIKAAKNGILSEGGVSGGKITNNKITDSEERGIYVANATNLDISKNTITTVKKSHGIAVDKCSGSITGNTVTGAAQHGIMASSCASGFKIADNTVKSSGLRGINVSQSEAATISGNSITSTGKTADGIYVDGVAKTTISKNTVSKAGGHGIRVQGTAKKKITATISGNISSTANSDYADIRIGDYCANCSVTGNLTPSAKGVTISKTGTSGTKVTAAKFSVKLMRYTSAKDTESKVYKIEFGVGKALDKVATLKWSKKGYTFKGWASAKDGKVVYSDGQTIKSLASKPDETVTLYAVWSPIKYNVSFDANGGTGKMSTVKNREYGSKKALSGNQFKRENYAFTGWATAKGGSKKYGDKTTADLTTKNGATVKLYACWKLKTFSVAFDANGGKGTLPKGFSINSGATKKIGEQKLTRTGYTFAGWTLDKSGKGAVYKDKGELKGLTGNDGDKFTLYAKWSPVKYAVAYNANGGKGSIGNTSLTYNKEAKLAANTFTKSGYTFLGWAKSAERAKAYTVDYTDQKAVKNLSSKKGATVTLYAVWGENYTVKFFRNVSSSDKTAATQAMCVGKAAALKKFADLKWSKTGYTFKGWAKSVADASAGKVSYTDAKTVKNLTTKKGATVSLYAVWGANSYTVKFMRNVSSADTVAASQAMTVDKEAALKKFAELKWSKTGYTFKGWAKSAADASAGKVAYADAKTVKNLTTKKGATVSLYAVWSANSYTVKFVRNVSSADTFGASQTMIVDKEAALRKFVDLKWSKPGYTFKGWAKSAADASAGKVAYTDAKTVKNLATQNGATVSLYAVWSANSYTVKFMRNVSSADTVAASQTMTVDKETALKKFADLKWSNTGYIFKGWATSVADASAGKVSYTDAQTVKNLATNQGATVLLYAVWVPVEYNVAFDANGGDGTMEPVISRTWGDAQALPANVFTRDGYTFGGWALAPDGEKAFDDQSRDNITSQDGVTVTLYAVWNINTYTVVFDSQGGSDVASAKRTYGAKIGELPVPEKEGYKFLGWFTAQENGEEISEETKVTGDATYYAQWESLVPEIDYDSLSSVEGWEELPDWAMGFFTCSNDNYEVYIEIAEFGFCSTVDLGVYYKYYEAAIEETLPLIVPVTEALLQRLGLEPEDIDQIGKTAYLFRNVTHEYCNIHDADDTREPVVFDVFVYEDFTIDGKGHVVSDKTVVSAEFEIDAVPEEEEEPEPEPVEELPDWAKGEFLCSGNEYMVRITIDKSLAYLSQVYSCDEDGNEIVIYNATKTTPPVAVKVTDDILLKLGVDGDYAEDVGETAYLYKAVVYEATVVEGDEEGDETGTARNPITLDMYIYHDLANDGMGRIVCDMTVEEPPLYIDAWPVVSVTTEDPEDPDDPELDNSGDPD